MPQKTPLALIILDGFGYRAEREGNAIALADMPFYDELLEKYPHTLIASFGRMRRLAERRDGKFERWSLCLGAGRVLRTDIEHINHEIATGGFFQNLAAECGDG